MMMFKVLEGHKLEILCMDVSQITKAVVSYSPGLLLIHAPTKSEGAFMSDHVISLGTLKYELNYATNHYIDGRSIGDRSLRST